MNIVHNTTEILNDEIDSKSQSLSIQEYFAVSPGAGSFHGNGTDAISRS